MLRSGDLRSGGWSTIPCNQILIKSGTNENNNLDGWSLQELVKESELHNRLIATVAVFHSVFSQTVRIRIFLPNGHGSLCLSVPFHCWSIRYWCGLPWKSFRFKVPDCGECEVPVLFWAFNSRFWSVDKNDTHASNEIWFMMYVRRIFYDINF